jgi:hypothetical protein
MYQIPVEGLPQAPGGQHTVQVIAKGARYYPDPSLTHLPPTLSVTCKFAVAGASGGPSGATGPAGTTNPPATGTGASEGAAVGGGGATTSPTSPTSPGGGTTPGGGASPGGGAAPSGGGTSQGGSTFQPDFDLLRRCKTQMGVVGAYQNKQQFDTVVACYVQGAVAAGSPLSPAEIEQQIRKALAF